jgi:hypothetical protein
MHKVLSFTGIESHYFVVDSVPSHIPVRPPSVTELNLNGVLDRSLVAMGTAVPQTMWTPSFVEDKTQLIGAELQMPIFFEGVDGQLGLSLELAATGRCHGLINAQRFAPLGPSQKSLTDIRIMVSAIYCLYGIYSNHFLLCSGWATGSSGAKFKFETKRGSVILLLLRSWHITLGDL